MWRLVVLASLALTLALGGVAAAKCDICVERVEAQTADGGPWTMGKSVTLTVSATSPHGARLPDTAQAVIMQVDDRRTKCITVSLAKTGETRGTATYVGTFTPFLHATHSGRIDIGGSVHEFTVPMSGERASVRQVEPVALAPSSQVQPPVTAPAAAAAPAAEAGGIVAPLFSVAWPDPGGLLRGSNGIVLVAIVVLIAGSLYSDRRRARSEPTPS